MSLNADQEHTKGFFAFLEENEGEFQFTDEHFRAHKNACELFLSKAAFFL